MQILKYNDKFEIDENTLEIFHRGQKEPLKVTYPEGWYPLIFLVEDKEHIILHMHKIVAIQFVNNPDPENFKIVNHLDGDKLNYRPNNLEWTNQSGNLKHAYRLGLRMPVNPSNLDESLIHEICKEMECGSRNKEIREKFCFLPSTILSEIRTGRTWKNISKLYDIPLNRRCNMSKDTAEWICQKLQDGLSCSEISNLSKSKVSVASVERIRCRKSFTEVSYKYIWKKMGKPSTTSRKT